MQLYHLIINAQPVLDTFSPVEILERLLVECKKAQSELPVDVYTTEVK